MKRDLKVERGQDKEKDSCGEQKNERMRMNRNKDDGNECERKTIKKIKLKNEESRKDPISPTV